MPLHDYKCQDGHVTELLVPLEHMKVQICERCGKYAHEIPSAPTFRFAGRPQINDGGDDPWEGTPLEGMGEPDVLRYKSEKIQVDMGTKTGPGTRSRPVDWAQRVAEAVPPKKLVRKRAAQATI